MRRIYQTRQRRLLKYLRLPVLSILFLVFSCKEDEFEEPPIINNTDNQHVNAWIQENMEHLYLWNDGIPKNKDTNLEPDEYFVGLLHAEDRFSWIQPNYQELLNSLKGINREAGFEFVLYKDAYDAEKVVSQILYVKPGSPAESANLKRGDLISHINGTRLTTSNYKEVIQQLKENHSLTYKPLIVGEDQFGSETTVSLAVVEYSENPNHLFQVINEGEHKIGYYVYNLFASGPSSDSKTFDDQMDNIFGIFKAEGITDLVLDLRFNSGGSEIAATNLASLIGAGINQSSLFFRRDYNQLVREEIVSDPELGEDFLNSYFVDKPNNVGSQLHLNRVYILTSSRTASASELVINGLEPYMDVFLIGDVTYGKNVGSLSIYEEDDPKNTWGMQPIVVKVSNSEGFAEYGDGFVPDVEDKDNSLYLYPLGDKRENLLSMAIAHIKGTSVEGRVRPSSVDRNTMIGHSLDLKRSSYTLEMDGANSLIPQL